MIRCSCLTVSNICWVTLKLNVVMLYKYLDWLFQVMCVVQLNAPNCEFCDIWRTCAFVRIEAWTPQYLLAYMFWTLTRKFHLTSRVTTYFLPQELRDADLAVDIVLPGLSDALDKQGNFVLGYLTVGLWPVSPPADMYMVCLRDMVSSYSTIRNTKSTVNCSPAIHLYHLKWNVKWWAQASFNSICMPLLCPHVWLDLSLTSCNVLQNEFKAGTKLHVMHIIGFWYDTPFQHLCISAWWLHVCLIMFGNMILLHHYQHKKKISTWRISNQLFNPLLTHIVHLRYTYTFCSQMLGSPFM